MNYSIVIAVAFLAASLIDQWTTAQCTYDVEVFSGPDCQFLPSFAHATGIADNGAMCGSYVDCAEVGHHVTWWADGSITELPPSADGGIPDSPFDINSAGEVAGRMHVPGQPSPLNQAFVYSNGVTLDLGLLAGQNTAQAIAINSNSAVVGYSNNTGFGPLTAFVWQNGKMSALPLTYGTKSEAYDISDTGFVCGWMGSHAQKDTHAFIYDLSTGTITDVGVVLKGAIASRAKGVNNAGTICGTSPVPCGKSCFTTNGFIWRNGEAQDLGVLPGKTRTLPQAINDSNVIVGFCDPGTVAFVWRNGTMTALNDLIPSELNLNISLAWDINNAGQIVGEATILGSGGDRVAVRLTPIPSPIGDSDCDSDIDVDDLLGVINNWAHESPKGSNALPPCDFDHDGLVEVDDLMIVINNWTSK